MFNINNNDEYTPYALTTIATLAPFVLTATPTITTVANTYNSITLRIKNNEPGPVAVYADRITNTTPPIAEPQTLIGVIQNQNGTLDVPYTNLPTHLTEYFFAIQVRLLNESKLRSNLLVYSEFTTDFPEIGPPTNWRVISTSRPFNDRIDWEVGWDAPTGPGSEFHSGYQIQYFSYFTDTPRPTVTTESPGVEPVIGTNILTRSGSELGGINNNPPKRGEIRIRSVSSFGKKSAYTPFFTFTS
jgi:hypothetical protein